MMNRSLRLLRLPAIGCGFGDVLTATVFNDPERGTVNCPAAPLLAAALEAERLEAERIGLGSGPRVRLGRVHPAAPGTVSQASGVMFAVSYVGRDGAAGGFALAAHAADKAGVAVASRAARRWMGTMHSRRLLMDGGAPLCWGARRAMRLIREAGAGDGPVYVFGRPVADRASLEELRCLRVVFTEDPDMVLEASTVVFPAHGTSLMTRAVAASRGLRIVDGTCPLVTAVQADTTVYADRGDLVVMIGNPRDAVVPPLMAQAQGTVVVVRTRDDVSRLEWDNGDRVSFVIDPAMTAADAMPVLAALRSRFPRLRGHHLDVMCGHASDRLHAISSVAADSELVLIVAGSGEDEEITGVLLAASDSGARTLIVRCLADIDPDLLAGVTAIGLVTTLSAPAGLAERVARALSGLGPLSVYRRGVSTTHSASLSETVAEPA
jgi:4-hydroxy-3-methylbut-2-enyl diphosphate reductase